MDLAKHFWTLITWAFAIGVVGSIATVVLFALELARVALSKDDTAQDYTPQDSTNS